MTAAMLWDMIKRTFCRCIYEAVSLESYYPAVNEPLTALFLHQSPLVLIHRHYTSM